MVALVARLPGCGFAGCVHLWGSQATPKGKLTHLRLLKLAKKRPGRLAAKKLQEMANLVHDQGEERVWKRYDTPVAAKAYYLRVIKPELSGNFRALREIKTLCFAVDHLAANRSVCLGVSWKPGWC